MSSATESFDVTTSDGRKVRITIDRRELAGTMIHRLANKYQVRNGQRKYADKVNALEGGVKCEWVRS